MPDQTPVYRIARNSKKILISPGAKGLFEFGHFHLSIKPFDFIL